ncbi:MAG: hypothetical protein RLZ10_2615, partial [Bacteroidota bacterium]
MDYGYFWHTMNVKIVNNSNNLLPAYESDGAAGMDVRANLSENIVLKAGERILIPTGLFISLPSNIECQVRPRSGLALKKGISVINTPGTIDSDYRGEIGVILINLSQESVTIEPKERIAQLVFCPVIKVNLIESNSLDTTERGI